MVGIYGINSKTKPFRVYIGSSINITDRWKSHVKDLKNNKHHSSKLQNHYNKYGKDDLEFIVIVECDVDFIIKIEQLFIDKYNPYFNICRKAGTTFGYKHTEETKEKMKVPFTEEHKKNLSINTKGRVPWNKGIKGVIKSSSETKNKISSALKGRKKSKEFCENASKRMMGYTMSEETRIKLGNSKRGVKMSEEAKRKMSIAQLNRQKNKIK